MRDSNLTYLQMTTWRNLLQLSSIHSMLNSSLWEDSQTLPEGENRKLRDLGNLANLGILGTMILTVALTMSFLHTFQLLILPKPSSETLAHYFQYKSCYLPYLIQPPLFSFSNISCHMSNSLEAEPKRTIRTHAIY